MSARSLLERSGDNPATETHGRSRASRRPVSPGDVIAALSGALLPVVHAIFGAATIADDWYLATQHGGDWLDEIDRYYRPLQWLIHIAQYTLLGTNSVAHALVLALAGGVFGVVFRRTVSIVAPDRLATLAVVLWAVSPTSSTTHLWAATTPILVAMTLVCLAWRAALAEHPSLLRVTACASLSLLTYESGVVLAALALLFVIARTAPRDLNGWLTTGALPGGIFGATLAWNIATSPKSISRPLFDSVGDVPTILFGDGLFPVQLGPVWLITMFLPALVVGGVVLRGTASRALRGSLLGLGLTVAALAMPVFIGFPLAPYGLLDRTNAMIVPCVAIFLAGAVLWVGEIIGPLVGRALGVLLVAGMAVSSLTIASDVRATETDLRTALAVADSLDGEVAIVVPVRSAYIAAGEYGSLDIVAEAAGYPSLEARQVSSADRAPTTAAHVVVVDRDGTISVLP